MYVYHAYDVLFTALYHAWSILRRRLASKLFT